MFRIVQSILALALVSCVSANAQTKTAPPAQRATTAPGAAQPDVIGYRDCKWGSTLDQVKAALKDEIAEPPEPPKSGDEYIGLVGPLEVKGIQFEMKFWFDVVSKQLQRVVLGEKSNHASKQDFETMLTALTQKYGKPTLLRSGGSDIGLEMNADWVFPTTSIKLKLTKTSVGLDFLYVDYRPSVTKANDKL